jgi:hypothetical protein
VTELSEYTKENHLNVLFWKEGKWGQNKVRKEKKMKLVRMRRG